MYIKYDGTYLQTFTQIGFKSMYNINLIIHYNLM